MFGLKLLRLVITHPRAMRAQHHHNRVYNAINQIVYGSGSGDGELGHSALALVLTVVERRGQI